MSKIQPFKEKKEKMDSRSFTKFLLVNVIWIIFTMYLYGMSLHYFPEPIHVGFGQYFALSEGVILLGFLGFFILTSITIVRRRK